MSFLLKENDISQNINNASSIEELENIRVKLLGKKGLVTQEMVAGGATCCNELSDTTRQPRLPARSAIA